MQTRSQTLLMQNTPTEKVQEKTLSTVYLRTRSKTSFIIDFDEASREWNRNKRRVGQGCYVYLKNK
jgi:hypothetical protein